MNPTASDDDLELLITATDPQARSAREDYALQRRRQGDRVWRAPRIVSLRQWLIDQWTSTWPVEQLLSSTQALAMWLQEIEADPAQSLLSNLACARESLRAHRTLLEYGLDPHQLAAWTPEQRSWLKWHRNVTQRMCERDWLLPEQLPERVGKLIDTSEIPLPKMIHLAGFDRQPPQMIRGLFEYIGARCHISQRPTPAGETVVQRHRCHDSEQQFRHVAAMVRDTLRAADAEALPRVLLVVPDPDRHRQALDTALTDLVAPWRRQIGQRRGTPWRWERGPGLTAQPWVEAAMSVLTLERDDNPVEQCSRLLLSPVLWPQRADDLYQQAAALDRMVRQLGRPRLRLQTLIDTAAATPIGARLQSLSNRLREEPGRALPSVWAECFGACLQAVGWPGETALPSEVFQSVVELRQRLSQLAGMDGVLGEVSRSQARLWLDECLRGGFEARAEHEQPLTIAAPDEAVGLDADLLIITEACTDAFPGRAQPSPFLDVDAQRRAGVPESAPESYLESMRQTLQTLCAHAGAVQVYAPSTDSRGVERMPAALLGDDWPALNDTRTLSLTERMAAAPPAVIRPDRDPVPPVADDEPVQGNSALFTVWFESPFFAFCTHRLGLEPLPQPGRGLDPRVQGQILHAALDRLWQDLKDSKTLQRLDGTAVSARIDAVLTPLVHRHLPVRDFGATLVRLEHDRLRDLLRQWLRHEARRVDPFTVLSRETPLQTTLAGLPLSLKLDRLDRVDTAEGPRYLVIDYKTGSEADPKGWEEDRLRDPQLPLYATLASQLSLGVSEIDGICFAHLKDGHPALSATSDWCASLIEPPTRPDRNWQERLLQWRQRLESAARAFLAGEAGFDPGKVVQHSHHAWLRPLTNADTPTDDDAT